MAAMTSKFNYECAIQDYTDRWSRSGKSQNVCLHSMLESFKHSLIYQLSNIFIMKQSELASKNIGRMHANIIGGSLPALFPPREPACRLTMSNMLGDLKTRKRTGTSC